MKGLRPQFIDPSIRYRLYLYESRLAKYTQMLGNLRLAETKAFNDFSYGQGTVSQKLNDV
ncbi:hypothetical protein D3C84_1290140 [compost metagenome]